MTPGTFSTVTPGVFIADYTLPAATPLAASVVTPGVFVSDYALPAATVVVAGGVVTPGVFIADFALPAATALGAGLVTPSVFVAPYTLPAATTLAGVLTTPAVFAADWSVLTITRYGVIVQTITAPESASLYRLPGANPRLVVGMGPRRSMTVGLNSREGWERVSEQFKMNGTTEGIAEIDVALEAVWATHSGSAAATLKAAIDSALNTYGFRRGDGSSLV